LIGAYRRSVTPESKASSINSAESRPLSLSLSLSPSFGRSVAGKERANRSGACVAEGLGVDELVQIIEDVA
jgi:hypothetical protein